MEKQYFTLEEKKELLMLSSRLLRHTRDIEQQGDVKRVRSIIADGISHNHYKRDRYGINPTIHNLQTALHLCEKISPDRNMIIAILLFNLCKSEFIPAEEVKTQWNDDIAKMIGGLMKVSSLYSKLTAAAAIHCKSCYRRPTGTYP